MIDPGLCVELQQQAERMKAESSAPLIVICLPAFNPPFELLQRQIASLRAQTHRHWLCLISDDGSAAESLAALQQLIANDPRFVLTVVPQRLGLYHNAERCLSLVPAQANFVALADQDDDWYPAKLARLLAGFHVAAKLVYSDMRVVDEGGQVLAETYWTTWSNNHTDLASLLFASTIAGAASLFRRELLPAVLPFPPSVGGLTHDHWLACVALACGEIEFVAEPLYDYVQHGSNVAGHFTPPKRAWLSLAVAALSRLARAPAAAKLEKIYAEKVLKSRALAQMLLQRCAGELTGPKRADLQKLAQLEASWAICGWLAWRGARQLSWREVALPAEHYALAGVLWRRWGGGRQS